MANPLIDVEAQGGVRVLTVRRPPVNAIDLPLATTLLGALAEARSNDACRALVLTGLPGVFSAGIDVREVPTYDAETRATLLRTVNRMLLELYGMPKPTIAALSGHALGGALVIAIACDVRVAARGPFKLGLTEAAAGVPFPAGAISVVRAELSPEVARVLVLGSQTFAPDAFSLDFHRG
jgi:enoyl-CoA hydratase